MQEVDPFENITDDWYFCSIMNKEVRFISHMLRGVTYFIVLEQKYGGQYNVPIKKNDIVQYLSKFKLIEKENKNMAPKDEIEDFTDNENLDDDEKDEPVYLEDKKKKAATISTTSVMVQNKKELTVVTVMPSLRDELFSIIELVKAGKIDNAKAREIANLSQVIINAAKFELDCIKMFPDEKKKLIKQ